MEYFLSIIFLAILSKGKKRFLSFNSLQTYLKKHFKNINVLISSTVKDGHVEFKSFKVITIPLKEVTMLTVLLTTPILLLSRTKNILQKLKKKCLLLTSG